MTSQYAGAVRDIALEFKHRDVKLVDLWTALMEEAVRLSPGDVEGKGLMGARESGESEGLRKLLIDGLHLTRAGYEIFLREVVRHVGVQWAKEPLDSPAWIFP